MRKEFLTFILSNVKLSNKKNINILWCPKYIKEMLTAYFIVLILATVLPSLRISPLTRIVVIVLSYTAVIIPIIVYIQSIGSGIEIFSDLFFEASINQLLISSLPLIKPRRLTKKEQEAFSLSSDLKEILVGLILGDLFGRFRYGKARFIFKQGIVHEAYLLHLYEIFKNYCPSAPVIAKSLPHYKTGKVYSSILFGTYTLPCFNELYNLFYVSGKKAIPSTIGDLLTPLSLSYWIADDGCWNKVNRHVILCTDSFSLEEVEVLIEVLNKKFNLKCYKCKSGNGYRIIIPAYSVPDLQNLLASHIPPMMRHKIGL
jgi:hypothetical protein